MGVTARLLSAGLMATLVNKHITHLHETTEASCTERLIITSHDKTLEKGDKTQLCNLPKQDHYNIQTDLCIN